MCSFIFCSSGSIPVDEANRFSRFRGPDKTVYVKKGCCSFVHNLLSITGQVRVQPITDGNVSVVYNGEIYNYKSFGDYRTDGDCLIPLYREYGFRFTRMLDGEFAIVLVDLAKKLVIISSDVFATKPLWIASKRGVIAAATYRSCLVTMGFAPVAMPANRTQVHSLTTGKVTGRCSVFDFDLRQFKSTYDDWIVAFEEAVRKRAANTRERIFLGLSSGYDSGAIVCELERQGISYRAYTILGSENRSVVEARHQRISGGVIIQLERSEYEAAQTYLRCCCEDFICDKYVMKKDKASVGLCHICAVARSEDRKIYLSGQGADEIISDYGFNGQCIFGHSHFGGKFPSDLSSVFPFRNFYGGAQARYLAKEEYVAGSHGVEARFPFLDPEVVQEFLNLQVKLKNSHYKAPIRSYFVRFGFPFHEGKKIGFQANRNLVE